MKEYMEFSAKTVDEAITKALLELSISSDRLEYEIIDKGSNGILGIFSRPAVIRAVKPIQDEDEFLLEMPKKKEAAKTPEREAYKAPVKTQSKTAYEKAAPRAQKPQVKEQPERKPVEKKPADKPVSKPVPAPTFASVITKPADEATLALLNRVEKFLGEMFDAMHMAVTIETGYDEAEKTIIVNLSGSEMGVLIGKRGQTLDSIQYLASLVVNKGEEEYIRVKVDTENYRERRKETLETLARNISFKVKRTKRPVSLEPMNPYERRVIHAALQNDKYVVTRSEGVEPYRHIVISPKNTRYGSRK